MGESPRAKSARGAPNLISKPQGVLRLPGPKGEFPSLTREVRGHLASRGLCQGFAREVGFDAEVRTAPVAERFHEWHQLFAFAVQGIGDLRGNCGSDLAQEDAIGE